MFMTRQKKIEMACDMLHARVQTLGPKVPKLNVYAVYSAQPIEMWTQIFTLGGKWLWQPTMRRVLSQCCGIQYVVDPCFAKQSVCDPKLDLDSLVISPIPQGPAPQRAGRAGRTEPDECYRLYTDSALRNEMLATNTKLREST